MHIHSITAALLSTALIVGCSDRNSQNSANPQGNDASAAQDLNRSTDTSAQARREAVSPDADTSAASVTRGARATTGSRVTAQPILPDDRTDRGRDRFDPSPRNRNVDRNNGSPIEAAPARRLPEVREVRVAAGTTLPLELMTTISSETATVETPVRARVRQAVMADGVTAIPAGAVLSGTVTDVANAGRVQGRSHLTFRFNEVQVNGVREELNTNPITFQGEATKGEDATKIGVGAGIGAALGGILGGAKGAAKGAALGGAGGAGVVLATKGAEVEVAQGADVSATLASPLTLRVPLR